VDRDLERVKTWIEERAGDMGNLLSKLIELNTENPPGRNLGRCAEILRAEMDGLGLEPEILRVPPRPGLEDPSVVRGTAGHGPRLIYFHGHFDVVPAQDPDQFVAKRRNGRVVGRGAADMKGGIVSMLYGAAAAKRLGLIQNGRIVIHLVCDEETGSVAGSGHLRDSGLIDANALAMVTAEPSSGHVWNAARGAISLRVTVQGREAHVGHANLGVNAFEHMIGIARAIEPYVREMAERDTQLAMDSADVRGSMVVIGGLSGSGSSFNAVPGSAWFTVDGRFNPEENLGRERERMTVLIEQAAHAIGAEVKVEVIQFQPPAIRCPEGPASDALSRCIQMVEGFPAPFELCPGILENRWYSQLGIPAFAFGAGGLDVAHGPEEFIDEAKMRRCAQTYALFAREMLAHPRSTKEPGGE